MSAAEREAWLADYAGLKTSMQQGYANLDWIVAHRGLDLADLDRKTLEALGTAQSRADAVTAIDSFFTAFRDPHFRPFPGVAREASLRNAGSIVAHEPSDAKPSAEDEPRSQSCADLGYKARERSGAFELADLKDWTPLESEFFKAGVSGRTAVLRIPSFDEMDYPAACEAAWQPGRTQRETQLATRALLPFSRRSVSDRCSPSPSWIRPCQWSGMRTHASNADDRHVLASTIDGATAIASCVSWKRHTRRYVANVTR